MSLTCAGDAREVLGGRLRHSKRHPAPLSHVRPCTYNVRPCTYNVVRTSSSHLYLQRCAHLLQSPTPTFLLLLSSSDVWRVHVLSGVDKRWQRDRRQMQEGEGEGRNRIARLEIR